MRDYNWGWDQIILELITKHLKLALMMETINQKV